MAHAKYTDLTNAELAVIEYSSIADLRRTVKFLLQSKKIEVDFFEGLSKSRDLTIIELTHLKSSENCIDTAFTLLK